MELKELIQSRSQIEIKNYMVFRTAICGFFEGKLITILPSSKKLLPYTILVTTNEFNDLKVKGSLGRMTLSFNGEIEYHSTQVQIGVFKVADYNLENNLKNFLIVFGNETNDLFTELKDKGETYIKVFQLLDSLKKKDMINTNNILGSGVGLTPALDDFVLGLYSYLVAKNDKEQKRLLETYIYKNIDTTTLISKWALKYAVDSQLFSETISTFYRTGDISDLFPMLQHGSTSGLDMIAGIYFGIKVFGNLEY